MILAIWLIIATVGFIYLAAHYNFWRSKASKTHPRILMYHSINHNAGISHPDLVVTPANFKAQLQYLKKNHYQFFTMSELIARQETSSTPVARPLMMDLWITTHTCFPCLKNLMPRRPFFFVQICQKSTSLQNNKSKKCKQLVSLNLGRTPWRILI